MPTQYSEEIGYILHPVDLAVNKVLALAGRDEPRDFIDIDYITKNILSLGALCWAAPGKDPGFTPHSLLELLKRRGKYHDEDFKRLKLTFTVDLIKLKEQWLSHISQAETFINTHDPKVVGCLYYSIENNKFISPSLETKTKASDWFPHFGTFGGVLPQVII